jgi:signal peptidase II
LYYYLLAAFVIALDQFTKWLIVNNLELNERVSVLGEFFQLTSHRNSGAAFGILTGQRSFFLVITAIVTVGLVWYVFRTYRRGQRLAPLAYSFVLGGALGNFIDRLRMGEVVDFFKFRFQFDAFGQAIDYTYPIFNVADMAIFCGVTLALIQVWREGRAEQRAQAQTQTQTQATESDESDHAT